jgi:hypothetical protein
MVRAPVINLRVGDVPAGMVDDWGRDPGLVAAVTRRSAAASTSPGARAPSSW